ncbi:uncharacterized protein K460DRAFT_277480 [Cucurbitaria berberidis CBS 394.84]|uniref:Uncharacterized protein n=1 Tax=Cucurbitaria berberidis CBS 394.84 TaxID=1168544 RepID=A0A9P4LAA7_9PLEO|nr:uncharacterized protein K460DRAFT_277480 [Cucurbitaria berberidis CBS 394.84]KAF1847009.1 hypothetical protein K460DRAFT_277480 [Cucurbitaria berberidis CBS 394.84]
MSETIKGPGILWVQSRIAQSARDSFTEPNFLHWYDEEHIAEVISTSGIKNAFRYVDMNKTSPCGDSANSKPFLAFYPMSDLAFTLGDEFRNIAVKSDKLPGSGVIYDLADLDVSYLGFIGATTRERVEERTQYILTSGIKPEKELPTRDINAFYDRQTAQVSQGKGYIRSLRFRLLYARTNAQSRALKGLPTTDEPNPDPPTWLSIHEFSTIPDKSVAEALAKDPGDAETGGKQRVTQNEVHVWKLERVHGEGIFFE